MLGGVDVQMLGGARTSNCPLETVHEENKQRPLPVHNQKREKERSQKDAWQVLADLSEL
jgi:hypothetical protein